MKMRWQRLLLGLMGCLLSLAGNRASGAEGRIAIDRFVAAEAKEQGLSLVESAKPLALVRRLAYDLTGLPPDDRLFSTFSEPSNAFSIDSLVDSLIHSPQFGERMASMWMNVARYAEDQAHQVGNDVKHFYPNAYLYRDWVVKAFNEDLPYDEFIRKQLAADLYEGTDLEDLPALGFLGLGPKYYNRGRLEVMADEWEDRVDTVTRGFLGLTVACARCHDHKFDPISTEDYYGLAGVFASTKMVNAPYGKDPKELTEDEKKQGLYTMHIVEEGKARDLNVFIRGNVERKGDLVPRRFLTYFYADGEQPPVFSEGSGRRELAELIASPDNPLAAKVYVNRVWQTFFGRGIVGTPSNFGALGEKATHPELLDTLAELFVEHGWSTKWLVKEIVSSKAYQRSSDGHEGNHAIDPDNRYLWRMTPRRLSVEMWRDSLLTFADTLEERPGRSMKLDDPENRRRTLYGRVSRKKLNPLLMNHDYPDPNVHSAKRAVTTTPLQKLYAMNSEFVLGQAKAFVDRLDKGGDGLEDWVKRGYRYLFFRVPSSTEMALAMEFLSDKNENLERRKFLYVQALMTSNEISYLD